MNWDIASMLNCRVILSFNDDINIYLHKFKYEGEDISSFHITFFQGRKLMSYGTKYKYRLSRGIKSFIEETMKEEIDNYNFFTKNERIDLQFINRK